MNPTIFREEVLSSVLVSPALFITGPPFENVLFMPSQHIERNQWEGGTGYLCLTNTALVKYEKSLIFLGGGRANRSRSRLSAKKLRSMRQLPRKSACFAWSLWNIRDYKGLFTAVLSIVTVKETQPWMHHQSGQEADSFSQHVSVTSALKPGLDLNVFIFLIHFQLSPSYCCSRKRRNSTKAANLRNESSQDDSRDCIHFYAELGSLLFCQRRGSIYKKFCACRLGSRNSWAAGQSFGDLQPSHLHHHEWSLSRNAISHSAFAQTNNNSRSCHCQHQKPSHYCSYPGYFPCKYRTLRWYEAPSSTFPSKTKLNQSVYK